MSKPNRVAVTGFGVMTPAGFGEQAVLDSVLAGKHGFRAVTRFDTSPFRSRYAAQSGMVGSMLDLGLRLACDAVHASRLHDLEKTWVVLGIPGDYNALQHYWKAHADDRKPDSTVLDFLPSHHADQVAKITGAGGKKIVLNNACVASSTAIGIAFDRIASGEAESVLCGGYSLVTEEMFAKFDSGRAFAADGRVRSFSAGRSGMLLGDGGAIMMLESMEHARFRGANVMAEIVGWSLTCDAFHVCQPHPDGIGMARAMEQALARAGVDKEQVDYIHAHGTGTVHNDLSETKAVKLAFGDLARSIPVSSTKSVTGHLLEGTGAVETAISIVAMRNRTIPPTVGFEQHDPACDLDYVPNEPRPKSLGCILNLNASFGGNNTAIVLKAGEPA